MHLCGLLLRSSSSDKGGRGEMGRVAGPFFSFAGVMDKSILPRKWCDWWWAGATGPTLGGLPRMGPSVFCVRVYGLIHVCVCVSNVWWCG